MTNAIMCLPQRIYKYRYVYCKVIQENSTPGINQLLADLGSRIFVHNVIVKMAPNLLWHF